MSREPSYPKDAPVGARKGRASAKQAASAKGEKTEAPRTETPSTQEKADAKRAKQLVTGAAIGIGSAAIVAALLYANRSKKSDKGQ